MENKILNIIGGGLAGCEAALRAARQGLKVVLWEMKPGHFSPAHQDENLAELVCSNSLRSDDPLSAVGLLKNELRTLGSVVMRAAEAARVPAGKALAVDRKQFSRFITEEISRHPAIVVKRELAANLFPPGTPAGAPVVLATGPLTAEPLASRLAELAGGPHLYFYDALAPIVTYESLNLKRLFSGDRYGQEGQGDYLNAPLEKDQFEVFLAALLEADRTSPRPFEEARFFEGCLPLEVMAARGPRTLTFGPLKPVGLTDPATGRRPYAVVQLRRENNSGSLWNMVGFQTRLTWGAQKKVFRLIPGLERAEFARFGAIHRNTFLNAPQTLDAFMRLKAEPRLFAAGQLSGVEGYVESAAQGLLAGENAARQLLGRPLICPPPTTALGALVSHLTDQTKRNFQPSNINFGLFKPLEPAGKTGKAERSARLAARAKADLAAFLQDSHYER